MMQLTDYSGIRNSGLPGVGYRILVHEGKLRMVSWKREYLNRNLKKVRDQVMQVFKGSSFLAQEALRVRALGVSERAGGPWCQEQGELGRLVGNAVRE